MATAPRVTRRSLRRAGRIVPSSAAHLRGRSVRLAPGHAMDWHSTTQREEVLIAVEGRIDVDVRRKGRLRRSILARDQCLFLPAQTLHRVVNRSPAAVRYIYLTAG